MAEQPNNIDYQSMLETTETVFLKVDSASEKNFQFLTETGFWMVGFEIAVDGETYASFVKEKYAIGNLNNIVGKAVKETLKQILKDPVYLQQLSEELMEEE